MMFENCTKCQHAKIRPTKSHPLEEGMMRVKRDYHVKCMAGNTEKMVDYFKRNFSIPYGGIDEVFPCYEEKVRG